MQYPIILSEDNLEEVRRILKKHIRSDVVSVAEGDADEFWTEDKEVAIPLEKGEKPENSSATLQEFVMVINLDLN